MTRHTWRPGGATYYPMDGARQCDPLEPDDVIAALDAMAQEIENLRAELDGRAPVSPTAHWSPWLEWRGGPVSGPLPSGTRIEAGGDQIWSGPYNSQGVNWEFGVFRFRYLADNPAGWLPRGEFIPPAELWDEGCPVRCEWMCNGPDGYRGLDRLPAWGGITHIRLVARQPQAGLPEGWWITNIGHLVQPNGYVALTHDVVSRYVPAAIRQAVDAWLREMGDE